MQDQAGVAFFVYFVEHLPHGLKGEFLRAMINTQPNSHLVRDALLRGETVAGAQLERRSHIRID